jgi:hypothetical protein
LICRNSNLARCWLFIAEPPKQLIDIVWFRNWPAMKCKKLRTEFKLSTIIDAAID